MEFLRGMFSKFLHAIRTVKRFLFNEPLDQIEDEVNLTPESSDEDETQIQDPGKGDHPDSILDTNEPEMDPDQPHPNASPAGDHYSPEQDDEMLLGYLGIVDEMELANQDEYKPKLMMEDEPADPEFFPAMDFGANNELLGGHSKIEDESFPESLFEIEDNMNDEMQAGHSKIEDESFPEVFPGLDDVMMNDEMQADYWKIEDESFPVLFPQLEDLTMNDENQGGYKAIEDESPPELVSDSEEIMEYDMQAGGDFLMQGDAAHELFFAGLNDENQGDYWRIEDEAIPELLFETDALMIEDNPGKKRN